MSEILKIMLIGPDEAENFNSIYPVNDTELIDDIIIKHSGKQAIEYLRSQDDSPQNWPNTIFINFSNPNIGADYFLKQFENLPAEMKRQCAISIMLEATPKDLKNLLNDQNIVDSLDKPLFE